MPHQERLSKATTSLSLMAIAFHVAVHTALKKLRTPPAQLLLAFACSLFVAQLLFLTGLTYRLVL